MNKYILLNHSSVPSDGWDAYFALLSAGGHFIGGSALDYGLSVSGGHFAEPISRTITGYIVIQAPDLETAKSLATQCPVHRAGGTVEVFTLVKS
ncbi:hypothetical protein BH09VER1_BH09VER1_48380 [soil metagenome]